MLEDHIAKLNEEIQARDKLDTEIQSAVVGLFEKQKELQEAVHALADRLREAGVEPAGVVRNKALLAPATRQS